MTVEYGIVRRGWSKHWGFQIMKITSANKQLIYGSIDNIGTRISQRDLIARFTDLSHAKDIFNQVCDLYRRYDERIDVQRNIIKELERDRQNALIFLTKENN